MKRFLCTACVAIAMIGPATDRAYGQSYGSGAYGDDSDGELGLWLLVAAGTAAASPFWGPILLTGDDYKQPGYFAEYPYKHGMNGYMLIGSTPVSEPYSWAVQAKTAYAANFGRVGRIDTGLQLEGSHRFGVDAEFNYWQESINPGPSHNFWTGDANLLFRFAQSEWLQTRAGLGGAWLEDGANSDYGFNFTYKADLFLRDPFILSTEVDWGTLGDETLFHPRVTIGAEWHRAEAFIGFDYFDIGPKQAASMVAGGRFWY